MPRPLSRWLPAGRTFRPTLTPLEDRSTPATVTQSGTALTVTLDAADERVSVVSAGATYTFTGTNPFSDGGVTAANATGFATTTLTVTAAGLAAYDRFEFVDSATGTQVLFADSGANAYADAFAVTLDDGSKGARFDGASDFAANDLAVTVDNAVVVSAGATAKVSTGNLTLDGNFTHTRTGGIVGVSVLGEVASSGAGTITIRGVGGNGATGYQHGVNVSAGGMVSGGSGAVSVTGRGGAAAGYVNSGVSVAGTITSGGGSVTVDGTGGGNVVAFGGNYGVNVFSGGRITAGGSGAVSVSGRAGAAGDVGVLVSGSGAMITSGGGSVTVDGTGDGIGFIRAGVYVDSGGQITSGGSGAVSVTGRGEPVGASGVLVLGSGAMITSGGGSVTVDGTGGEGLGLGGVCVSGGGTITAGGSGAVSVTGRGGTGTGGSNHGVSVSGPGAITSDGGNVTVTAIAGEGLSVAARLQNSGRITSTGNGTVTLTADRVDTTGTSVVGGGILFANGGTYLMEIGGPAPGNTPTDYHQLNVTGGVTIEPTAALRPVLVGGFTPVLGQRFVIVNNDGTDPVVGAFAGLGEGAAFTLGGVPFVITYTGGDGNDVVLTVARPTPRVATFVGGLVQVIDPRDHSVRQFTPFPGFGSPVTVATGDLTGDGVPDVVAGAGPGGGPHVKVFDGASGAELASFYAFDPAFRGGVFVAVGDGRIVVGAGAGGGPHVKVINGRTLHLADADGRIADAALFASFYAYDPAFAGGVRVAAADLTGDGVLDIVTAAGPGGGPHVKHIDGRRLGDVQPDGRIADTALAASYYAFDPAFTGGVFVAAASGRIAVGADAGAGPHVKVIDGRAGHLTGADGRIADEALLANSYAYDPAFPGGVRVGFADADADGDLDLLTGAGPGGGPHVRAFHIAPFAEVRSFYATDPLDPRGVFVG